MGGVQFFSVFYKNILLLLLFALEIEREKGNSESGKYSVELEPGFSQVDNRYLLIYFSTLVFQYLINVNEIKTKKGTELLQHLVEYYHAQTK